MNFLAHLTLSHFSTDLQVGNFVGDFIRGRELQTLPPGIRRGVALHRAIDRLTDADPDVRALNRRLAVRHGRYAPVVSDIAFDHFLYLAWPALGPAPFPAFRDGSYATLLAARPLVGSRVRGYVDAMVQGDWLQLYTTPAGMAQVYDRLERRLSRPELLAGVNDTLREEAGLFNFTLRALFPRLRELADTYRD